MALEKISFLSQDYQDPCVVTVRKHKFDYFDNLQDEDEDWEEAQPLAEYEEDCKIFFSFSTNLAK